MHLRRNGLVDVNTLSSGAYKDLVYLNVRENGIATVEAMQGIKYCRSLISISLLDNPIVAEVPDYRLELLLLAPTLQSIDSQPVMPDERLQAGGAACCPGAGAVGRCGPACWYDG